MSASPAPPLCASRSRAPIVLVVEDNVVLRLAFADHLREQDFCAIEAGNAAEAIEVLSTDDVHVDFVFSDVAMPGPIDGFGLLKWVKANKPNLPVLITSAISARRRIAQQEFAHAFVDKPYDFDEVTQRIRDEIDSRK
jgi:DNA-binding NtrC family response regulator